MIQSADLEVFKRTGYVIVTNPSLGPFVNKLRTIFLEMFYSQFSSNVRRNSNILKRFGDHPSTREFFSNSIFLDVLSEIGIKSPNFCGPILNNFTGNQFNMGNYGLDWHQDWPSMGSSKNSVVLWMDLFSKDGGHHGLEVSTDPFLKRKLRGRQNNQGYMVEQPFNSRVLNLQPDQFLIFSSFLVHRTHVAKGSAHPKLSLSVRIDDFADAEWADREFESLYRNNSSAPLDVI